MLDEHVAIPHQHNGACLLIPTVHEPPQGAPGYDCLYVALAEQEQCEVVTVDDKFLNSIQKQFPFVIHLAIVP